MKNGKFTYLGQTFMKLFPIKVIIIDDVKTYFNDQMLNVANSKGNFKFERYYKCDNILLQNLISNPRDILIIDIKGVADKTIGKDGFDIAKHVFNNTNTYVVITSAHKFHLQNRESYGDYIMSERLLTPIDFTDELNIIVDNYLKSKTKIYQKIGYKIGKIIFKYGLN